ncbi:hypothetical protein HWV62_33272 [Athelia sp. TMB]|nr:hypothetical protein HWV62_33272 [Athelia sp. TMB]
MENLELYPHLHNVHAATEWWKNWLKNDERRMDVNDLLDGRSSPIMDMPAPRYVEQGVQATEIVGLCILGCEELRLEPKRSLEGKHISMLDDPRATKKRRRGEDM